MTSTTTPTISIVPGAWHRRIHVQPLLDVLERRGYKTRCIELASVRTDRPQPTWDEEVSNISSRVLEVLDDGQDVCLIAHSYAGTPGCDAVNRIIQAGGLEPRAGKGRLRRVIFFAAHHFPLNFTFDAKAFTGPENPSFWIDENTNMSHYETPYENFFAPDISKDEAKPYIDAVKPMYYIPGGGAITSDDWMQAPRTIIGTNQDQAIPAAFLKQMWSDFEEEIEWIDGGHSPFFSKPDYIADVLITMINKK